MSRTQPPAHYEITVEGVLDPRWSAWFGGMQLASDAAGRTTITGPVADQAALHGQLARIRDLGLPLLALRRIETPLTSDTTASEGWTPLPPPATLPALTAAAAHIHEVILMMVSQRTRRRAAAAWGS